MQGTDQPELLPRLQLLPLRALTRAVPTFPAPSTLPKSSINVKVLRGREALSEHVAQSLHCADREREAF